MDIKNNEKNPGMGKSQKMQILPKVMDFFYIKTEKESVHYIHFFDSNILTVP